MFVKGNFTGWKPVPMELEPRGFKFQLIMYLPPGPKKFQYVTEAGSSIPRIRTLIIKPREKEIEMDDQLKVMYYRPTTRKFDKEASIFKKYRVDDLKTK